MKTVLLSLICLSLVALAAKSIYNEYVKARKEGGGSITLFWVFAAVSIAAVILLITIFSPREPKGQYHNIDTGRKQIQYQGSREQQQDLNSIDNYKNNNPDF